MGRSPGGGHGNLLQYSCLENPMDRGDWQSTVHVSKESDTTEATWDTSVNVWVPWAILTDAQIQVGSRNFWFIVSWLEAQETIWIHKLVSEVGALLWVWTLNLWDLMLSPGRQCQNWAKCVQHPIRVCWELGNGLVVLENTHQNSKCMLSTILALPNLSNL